MRSISNKRTRSHSRSSRARTALTALAGLLVTLFVAALPSSASAATGPLWQLHLYGQPTNFSPADAGNDMYFLNLYNVGDQPTDSEDDINITENLPAGVTASSVTFIIPGFGNLGFLFCQNEVTSVHCHFPGTFTFLPGIAPGEQIDMFVGVEVEPGTVGPLTDSVSVSGGGAPDAFATNRGANVSEEEPPFGVQNIEGTIQNQDGTPFTTAGGHPFEYAINGFINNKLSPLRELKSPGEPLSFPLEEVKDLRLDFPPGLIANPNFDGPGAKCSLANFFTGSCPVASQIGIAKIQANVFLNTGITGFYWTLPLFNVAPEPGRAATTGFLVLHGIPFLLTSGVRTGEGYGIRTAQEAIPGVVLAFFGSTLWGVPADPRHDAIRGQYCSSTGFGCEGGGVSSGAALHPYLRLPTDCSAAQLPLGTSIDSWNNPGAFFGAETELPGAVGCNAVPFEPSIQARPTTPLPDAPSGLDVDIHVPQEGETPEPEGVSSADLKDAVVKLPKGMKLNPASAQGLTGCTPPQIELEGPNAPTCPNSSKIGTVEVDSALVEHPLPGSVYLAAPRENPFGSLLAIYAVVNDPLTGTIIKLPAEMQTDPQTGQLTTVFQNNPQLPFEHFKMHFFGGSGAVLRTPSVCGTYSSKSVLTPWSAPESGPPATPEDSFAIGGNCASSEAAEPNSPRFHAGTETPQAATYSPLGIRLVREDGEQEVHSFDAHLPPGVTGRLAGVTYCPDAAIAAAAARSGLEERANPSCPFSSEVGSVDIGSGVGPNPIYVRGHAYLAGPYRGAPLSLVFITPVVAGPFDLGTTVVRAAVYLNPETVQNYVVSDQFPTILHGIPLDIRSVTVRLDRQNFILNPTNCEELGFAGSETSTLGVVSPLSDRFQVAGCAALRFKPKLALRLSGRVNRNGHPRLRAAVTFPQGGASSNIARAAVTLPATELLENAHIKEVCSPAEYAEDGGGGRGCPAGSAYGYARAWTPLLEKPLEGPVYLRSNPEHEVPDLVASLGGQIQVDVRDKIDTVRGRIRNTFEAVPDTPISRFEVQMAGGRRSLLVNTTDLCRARPHAIAVFTAHDGARRDTTPAVEVSGCAGNRKHRGHRGPH